MRISRAHHYSLSCSVLPAPPPSAVRYASSISGNPEFARLLHSSSYRAGLINKYHTLHQTSGRSSTGSHASASGTTSCTTRNRPRNIFFLCKKDHLRTTASTSASASASLPQPWQPCRPQARSNQLKHKIAAKIRCPATLQYGRSTVCTSEIGGGNNNK